THWQTATMTQAAIATQIHQTLDAHRQLTAQIAFDDELGDLVAQLLELVVVEILDLLGGRHTGCFADQLRTRTTNAINGGQTNDGVLMIGYVYPSDTCHSLFLNQ